jgi:hypothetical protein
MAHRVVEFRVRTAQDVLEQGRDEPGPADADKGKSRCLDDQIVASRVAKAEMLAPHDDRENDYRSRGISIQWDRPRSVTKRKNSLAPDERARARSSMNGSIKRKPMASKDNPSTARSHSVK